MAFLGPGVIGTSRRWRYWVVVLTGCVGLLGFEHVHSLHQVKRQLQHLQANQITQESVAKQPASIDESSTMDSDSSMDQGVSLPWIFQWLTRGSMGVTLERFQVTSGQLVVQAHAGNLEQMEQWLGVFASNDRLGSITSQIWVDDMVHFNGHAQIKLSKSIKPKTEQASPMRLD